jgi:hypothetical protein
VTETAIRPQAKVIRRVLDYPVPKEVIEKYVDRYELTEQVAREHEREFKRYLAMCLANPEAAYGMFGPIDDFWHTWILFTREWHEFGETVAGHYIHHRPTTRAEKALVRSGQAPSAYGRFLAAYPAFFGEEAPAHLWPRQQEAMAGADCSCLKCSDGWGHTAAPGAVTNLAGNRTAWAGYLSQPRPNLFSTKS